MSRNDAAYVPYESLIEGVKVCFPHRQQVKVVQQLLEADRDGGCGGSMWLDRELTVYEVALSLEEEKKKKEVGNIKCKGQIANRCSWRVEFDYELKKKKEKKIISYDGVW